MVTTGGYTETYPNDSTWTNGGTTNYAVSVSLNTPIADAIINETKGAPDIGFKLSLGSNELGYAQATVVGNEVVITTDSADANNNTSSTLAAYGLGGATGHVYRYNFATNTQGTTVIVEGGVSSIANSGTALYVGGSDKTQQLGVDAACATCGTAVDATLVPKLARLLWIITQ
jgi:hypothetical protein